MIAGRVTVPALVFSPFGLGVLDLAVGKYVYDEIAAPASYASATISSKKHAATARPMQPQAGRATSCLGDFREIARNSFRCAASYAI